MTPFDPRLLVIAAEARVRTTHVFHCYHAIREMGKKFHPGAFAQFAGLEERHVEAILAALEAHGAMPAKRSSNAPKGHRLPLDWTLPDDWRDWACEERRWEPSVVREEAAGFADYWHSVTGIRATKLDWRKTWQNWVRNSRRANGDYVPQAKRQTAEGWVDYCEAQLQRCKEANYRPGIEEWTGKLNAARDKVAANVLPFRLSSSI